MNRMILKILSILFICMTVFGVSRVSAQEFSADMESRMGKKVMSSKVYVADGKIRMDMPQGAMIIRNDEKKSFMIMDSQKMYMEQPIDLSQAPKVQKYFEGELERTSMGKETVNGHEAEKFKVTYKEKNKDILVYQWLVDGKIPAKIEAVDGKWSVDYKNLQIGAQAADLFEPPAGYSKMEMPNLKGLMGAFGK